MLLYAKIKRTITLKTCSNIIIMLKTFNLILSALSDQILFNYLSGEFSRRPKTKLFYLHQ